MYCPLPTWVKSAGTGLHGDAAPGVAVVWPLFATGLTLDAELARESAGEATGDGLEALSNIVRSSPAQLCRTLPDKIG